MFFPRGGFAVDLEALEDLGVPPDEARIRVLGLGSLEYAVLAAGAVRVRDPPARRPLARRSTR